MICKLCGGRLGQGDVTCPHCGASVPASEGGNGFWDLLDGPDVTSGAMPPVPDEAYEQQPAPERPRPSRLPLIIGAACLLASLVVCGFVLHSSHAAQAKLEQQVEKLGQQVEELKDRNAELEEQKANLEQQALEQIQLPGLPPNPFSTPDVDDGSGGDAAGDESGDDGVADASGTGTVADPVPQHNPDDQTATGSSGQLSQTDK